MIPRRAAVIACSIVTIGLITTGAGGPAQASVGRVSSRSATPLTQAQFISEANGFCAAAVTQFASVLPQFAGVKKNPAPSEIAALVNALAPIVQGQISKTRALNPPKADRAKVAAFLKANQLDLNKLKTDPQLMAAKTSPFLSADNLARKLGLLGAAGSGPCSKGNA